MRELEKALQGEGIGGGTRRQEQRGVHEADRGAGRDLEPGRGDEQPGQVFLLVVGAFDRCGAVGEVQFGDGAGEAGGEFVADRAHPQPDALEVGGYHLDADEGG
ncbi:hypothetical protein [uncultured Streptomyces sp.]|uniref:hypothetical protein n=1 Tax=uncultured Streptomyces sp. TaxID=174707 RepID=UPI0026377CA2|nr:hypothetical protein [uncultured Streptomyces sp.]